MKKIAWIIGLILAFVVSFAVVFWGIKISRPSSDVKQESMGLASLNEVIEDECTEEGEEIASLNQTLENEIVSASQSDEKISPEAKLVIKKYYKECGHTTKDTAEISPEDVNLTQTEIEQKYSDWVVESFNSKELVLYKQLEGICNEHYILREKDGLVAIYVLNQEGKEQLQEVTAISTEYLTEGDQIKIREGIRATGKQELNSRLEDYE